MNPLIATKLVQSVSRKVRSISANQLLSELIKASITTPIDWTGDRLDTAFEWANTTQGMVFWRSLSEECKAHQ